MEGTLITAGIVACFCLWFVSDRIRFGTIPIKVLDIGVTHLTLLR